MKMNGRGVDVRGRVRRQKLPQLLPVFATQKARYAPVQLAACSPNTQPAR
jgi:hypothetical protein